MKRKLTILFLALIAALGAAPAVGSDAPPAVPAKVSVAPTPEQQRAAAAKEEQQKRRADRVKARKLRLKKKRAMIKRWLKLPPILERIRGCESGHGPRSYGDYRAQNPRSTASGGFQFLDTTWAKWRKRFGWKARKAKYAAKWKQNKAAIYELRSQGTAPWLASRHCWGF